MRLQEIIIAPGQVYLLGFCKYAHLQLQLLVLKAQLCHRGCPFLLDAVLLRISPLHFLLQLLILLIN